MPESGFGPDWFGLNYVELNDKILLFVNASILFNIEIILVTHRYTSKCCNAL